MSSTRCVECHASIPVPVELDATVMRCQYCGAQMAVPDLEVRRRALVEQQREARLQEEKRVENAREDRRDAREHRERETDRKVARSSGRRTWLISLVPLLIAPTIIAITVFDAPARLGFGASGSDRLEQLQAQALGTGCTVLDAIDSEYADASVSRLIKVDHQCLRIAAAGGKGHSSLSLRLFGSDGKELAKAGDTTDPQLRYCATNADTLRYEIKVGPASKGRLSHLVLSCPTEPAKPAPMAAPAAAESAEPTPAKPSKPKRR